MRNLIKKIIKNKSIFISNEHQRIEESSNNVYSSECANTTKENVENCKSLNNLKMSHKSRKRMRSSEHER